MHPRLLIGHFVKAKPRGASEVTKENVIVTFVHSPLNFWINAVEKFEVLDTVMKILGHELFEKVKPRRELKQGMPCVVRSSAKRIEPQIVRAQDLALLFIY